MKAYQRLIRESSGIETDPALDIRTATVREISYSQAQAIIERHEWLGTMPVSVRHCYGLFFGERLAGAVVYADETGENLGVWDAYGFTGKIICLARGASEPWAHEHSGSKLIRGSMRLLPRKFKVITATADETGGELGVLYQAAGFDYVGLMSAGGARFQATDAEGNVLSDRQCRQQYKTASVPRLRMLGLTINQVPRKVRYFGFRGSTKEIRTLRAAIADKIRSYPKRVAFGHREIGVPGGKAGPGRGHKTTDIISRFKGHGTGRAYTMARLKRDHPKLAIRVMRGELSAHAAAIEAGFRKRYTTHRWPS
jgi:hypothetical protein